MAPFAFKFGSSTGLPREVFTGEELSAESKLALQRPEEREYQALVTAQLMARAAGRPLALVDVATKMSVPVNRSFCKQG
jgi:dihydroorotase-like cyclic amidohydrolase